MHALQSRDQLRQEEHFRDAKGLSSLLNDHSKAEHSFNFCIQKLDFRLFEIILHVNAALASVAPRLGNCHEQERAMFSGISVKASLKIKTQSFVFSVIENSTSRRH